MPTYEYRCPQGHHFELFQKMSEEPRANCPECGSESERLLSAGAGFLFKGDGFYITENRSASYKKDASKDGSPGETDSSSPGGAKEEPKGGSGPGKSKEKGATPSSNASSGGNTPSAES